MNPNPNETPLDAFIQSLDAQHRIRGKSPLQLAGYGISHIPLSTIYSGLTVDWPIEANLVPS